jgi:hypothetical protein
MEATLPRPRGPLSRYVTALLDGTAETVAPDSRLDVVLSRTSDLLTDEDFHLALWMLNELHYRGFAGCDDHEWDPATVSLRGRLDALFERELREATSATVDAALASSDDVVEQIQHVIAHDGGPSLASYLQREATREQLLEFLVQRSLYHLKESDPHSFVIPRIDGPAKAGLAELQYDEYGAGRPERLHATMYGEALEACGLDRTYGAYVDRVPGHTLAVNNVMSLFGLRRRLRGAALGHLAAFESTSSVPCRRIAAGIERVGLPDVAAAYFHEHVEADAVHEQMVLSDVCAPLVRVEPELGPDVVFGVAACLALDGLASTALLAGWRDDNESGSQRVAI